MNNELYHYGILGMHWGVRRYQNSDGTYTDEGRNRYFKSPFSNRQDKGYKRSPVNKIKDFYDPKAIEKKVDFGSSKKNKEFANGLAATRKAMTVIGAVAVVSLAAYGVYRYRDVVKDSFIGANQEMQRIHNAGASVISEELKPGNPAFVTFRKNDNLMFAQDFGWTRGKEISHFVSENGIKVASEKSGRDVFKDIYKENEEVREYCKRIINFPMISQNNYDKLSERQWKKMYRAWNHGLVTRDRSPLNHKVQVFYDWNGTLEHDRMHNVFYDALRNKGYGGVVDTWDAMDLGYGKKPTIIFDTSKKVITSRTPLKEARESPTNMLAGKFLRYSRHALIKPSESETTKLAAKYLAGYGLVAGVGEVNYRKHLKSNKRGKR